MIGYRGKIQGKAQSKAQSKTRFRPNFCPALFFALSDENRALGSASHLVPRIVPSFSIFIHSKRIN